jgi:hypothetical protein
MHLDHRPCPYCHRITPQRVITLDDGRFYWCQICFQVSRCPSSDQPAQKQPPGTATRRFAPVAVMACD